MQVARYDVLDLKYGNGNPAVLRHVDGSGFAYYPSGRKAICVSAHGNNRGMVRRFAAVVHSDTAKAPVLALFDEWGHGYADGQLSAGDRDHPKVMISEGSITVIDGVGNLRTVPMPSRAAGPAAAASGKSADISLRLCDEVVLQHHAGRTTLRFQSQGVAHDFAIGEMLGEDVGGMKPRKPPSLADATMKELGDFTQALDGLQDRMKTIRVDPALKETQSAAVTLDPRSCKGILDSLDALQRSLTHPSLAPTDLTCKTQGALKKHIAAAHPTCPGQTKHNWKITMVSGRCTDTKLSTVKPTVRTPSTVEMVSQRRIPDLVEEASRHGWLLIVICLTTWAKETSLHANLLAEKAQTQLHHMYQVAPRPFRFVAVELSELDLVARQYDVREAPFCLMFQGGNVVYSERIRGKKTAFHDTYMARPRVLLLEPDPSHQIKVERALRRNSFGNDLALDVADALRLASRTDAYGIVLASATLPTDHLSNLSGAIRRSAPSALVLLYNSGAGSDEDPDVRRRFFDECTHVFPALPSYTSLAAVLSRHDAARPHYKHAGQSKEDFVEQVVGMLERGPCRPMSHVRAEADVSSRQT